jgi:hypothetical protein
MWFLLIFVHFIAAELGSGGAFWIRIQKSQINADPCELRSRSGFKTLGYTKVLVYNQARWSQLKIIQKIIYFGENHEQKEIIQLQVAVLEVS